jgi:hypothetical protein
MGLRGFIPLGSIEEESISTKTTGMMNEERRLILYLNCSMKKIRTIHQAKKEVAS